MPPRSASPKVSYTPLLCGLRKSLYSTPALPAPLLPILSVYNNPTSYLSIYVTSLMQSLLEALPSYICCGNYSIQLLEFFVPPISPYSFSQLAFSKPLYTIFEKWVMHSTLCRKNTDQANSSFLLLLKLNPCIFLAPLNTSLIFL